MQQPQPIVIVDRNGTEHEFPAGFDPKRAAEIVRKQLDGGQPKPAQQPQAQPQNDGGGGIFGAIADVGIGAMKGVGNTVVGLGQLAHSIPGVSGAVDAIYGQPGISDAGFADANRRLEPTNAAQRVGKVAEQIAENILPGKAITRAGVALGARMARPLVGRIAAEAGAGAGIAAAQQGDPAMAGLAGGAMPLAGAAFRGARGVLMPGSKLNPLEREAVDFATRRGIPVDAATATGRPSVSRVQKMASDNLGGAGIAEAFKDRQAEALERVGNVLAKASNGGKSVDPVGAGEGVRASLAALRNQYIGEADKAYEALRAIENQRQLAVNLKPVKNAMLRTYQELLRESEVAPLMGQKAEALRVLDRLMRGPDMETLSVADAALSGLKSFARTADGALKTPGQGIVSGAVAHLDALVKQAATKGGPDAIKALTAGRAATVAKYQVDDVLDALSSEPKAVFDALTRRKDGGLETLRLLQKHTPQELPNVGRAYLEEMMAKATAEGGFGHADRLWSDWRNLGTETKRLLFPKLTPELDRFFHVAKMIAKNPNPSGTASQLNVARVMAMVPNWAVAKLMYTPAGVRIMTKSIQSGQTNELTAALGRITAVQGTKGGQ